jgi:hypothetical protein
MRQGTGVVADTRSGSFTQVSVPDGYGAYLLGQLFEPWAAVLTARAGIRPGYRRVARPGGTVVLSTWAAEHPLGLFGSMNETLREFGMAEPFPRAFDSDSYRVSLTELRDLLLAAGFQEVSAETVEINATWQTAEAATATLLGTPFGLLVLALPADTQQQIRARLASKLGTSAGSVTVRTMSNIVQGIK